VEELLEGLVYIPAILRMAETKRPALKDEPELAKELDRLIQAADDASHVQMAIFPNTSDPAWATASAAARNAAKALLRFVEGVARAL
jgi:hypothetical protein